MASAGDQTPNLGFGASLEVSIVITPHQQALQLVLEAVIAQTG